MTTRNRPPPWQKPAAGRGMRSALPSSNKEVRPGTLPQFEPKAASTAKNTNRNVFIEDAIIPQDPFDDEELPAKLARGSDLLVEVRDSLLVLEPPFGDPSARRALRRFSLAARPRCSTSSCASGCDSRPCLPGSSRAPHREECSSCALSRPLRPWDLLWSSRAPLLGSPIVGTDYESWVWRLAVC